MKYINWFLGSFFFLWGLLYLPEHFLSAVFFFVCAGLLIPPIRKFVGDKTGVTIPRYVRITVVIVLFFSSIWMFGAADKSQYEQQRAREGGFATVEEYKSASAEGFKTNEAYQKYLEKQKAQKVNKLEEKLASTIGLIPRIMILEELVALDPETYQSKLSIAKEKLRKHNEKIEADKLARQKRLKEQEAKKQREREEKTIGVWIDERWPQPAKFTLLKNVAGDYGELIIEFKDGSEKSELVEFGEDINGNLLFRVS